MAAICAAEEWWGTTGCVTGRLTAADPVRGRRTTQAAAAAWPTSPHSSTGWMAAICAAEEWWGTTCCGTGRLTAAGPVRGRLAAAPAAAAAWLASSCAST
jgi:hypothetical protein